MDQKLADQLFEFHRRAGLIYGAYDLIISKSGEPVFLEVNPVGDWMELENQLDIPIAREVAIQLIEFNSLQSYFEDVACDSADAVQM